MGTADDRVMLFPLSSSGPGTAVSPKMRITDAGMSPVRICGVFASYRGSGIPQGVPETYPAVLQETSVAMAGAAVHALLQGHHAMTRIAARARSVREHIAIAMACTAGIAAILLGSLAGKGVVLVSVGALFLALAIAIVWDRKRPTFKELVERERAKGVR
jgi:O-antigen/teichoic acid export membrane protein